MNVTQSRSLAALIEAHMFESAVRNGLMSDIRAGNYAKGKVAAPFISLRIILSSMRAPQEVMTYLQEMEAAEAEAEAASDAADMATALAYLQSSAGAAAQTWECKLTDADLTDAARAATEMLIPDGKFMQAREAEDSDELRMQTPHRVNPQ